MKKLLSLLAPILLTLSTFAQNSSNCGGSLDIPPIVGDLSLCEDTPSEAIDVEINSDLPNIGFFIANVGQPAEIGIGNAIISVDDDGIFIPTDLGIAHGNIVALSPFAYDLAEYRNLVDLIFNSYANGYPCCEYADNVAKDFCQSLYLADITNANDVDSFKDVWAIVNAMGGSTGNTVSADGFTSKVETIQDFLNLLPTNCQYQSDYCYAVDAVNEHVYEIKEVPTLMIDASTPNRITINADISSGSLQYSLDNINWQANNTFYGTPSVGTAYVKEEISGCNQEKEFFNTNLSAELIRFEGEAEDTNTLLEWTTATETNNDYFGIERSSDGFDFKEIDTVMGAGNSSSEINYTYRDRTPLTGTSYYRLMMYDFDGYSKESDKKSVKRNKILSFTIIAIGPNPSANMINVSIFNETPGEIQFIIYDVAGKRAGSGTQDLQEGINNFIIDATMMGTGMYLFTASKGDQIISTYKFVMH